MAGFEGPREPGGGDPASSKLPSWAVTRAPTDADDSPIAEPAEPSTFPDVGNLLPTGRDAAPRTDRPVARVPEHPFDVDDPFGDKQLGGGSSPWIRPPADDSEVRVVDLADEFHLTTAQALEVCAASGTSASSGAAWLTLEQADAFRTAVATYDGTGESGEEYPAWAIPPGGGRPSAARPSAEAVVPGAALLARSERVVDDEPPASGGRMRLVLLIAALATIVVLIALLLAG